ncbi:MAG: CaiB/BaiF CoA-transferase family protein [Alphaproteobacteria bacterium]|nr:CaiB/BaiF CoA-transferase family protein [Alphaproteobacteria bacterium]
MDQKTRQQTGTAGRAAHEAILSTIRVLDMSRVLAGPWAGQILADFGAEVIKVEQINGGDDTRSLGPPFAPLSRFEQERGDSRGDAAYFLSANRGKSSVAVNFKTSEGVKIVKQLIAQSDIVIENFKFGGLAHYGLDYATLAAEFPDLIYCSITGFGQTGPYAARAGYDLMIQAMGGFMSITGEPDGSAGGGPMKAGVAIADVQTGLYAAIAILAALYHRENCRKQGLPGGQQLDLSLLDVQVATLANRALDYLVDGKVPQRMGNGHPSIVPYRVFATRDGHCILAIANDLQFQKFCAAIGRADWSKMERFATNPARVIHRVELESLLEPIFAAQTIDYWLELLNPLAVPVGAINRIDTVFADPQVKARGLEVHLPRTGADFPLYPGVRNPIRMSGVEVTATRAPPALGEDTDRILSETLGYSPSEIAALRKASIVA